MNSQKDDANLPTSSMDNLSIVDKAPAAAPSITGAEDRIAPVGHRQAGTGSANPKSTAMQSSCSAPDQTSSAVNATATPCSCQKAAASEMTFESSTSSSSSSSSTHESNHLQAAAASASTFLRLPTPDRIGPLAPPATRSTEPLTQRKRDFIVQRRNRMTRSVYSTGMDLLREVLQKEVDEGMNPQDSASDLALLDEDVEGMEERRRAAAAAARNAGAEDNNERR